MQSLGTPSLSTSLGSAWRLLHPQADPKAGELYQTATMAGLLEGAFEGVIRVDTLRQHGDVGLWTFQSLDGEMVATEGNFFQLSADGKCRLAFAEQKAPFATRCKANNQGGAAW